MRRTSRLRTALLSATAALAATATVAAAAPAGAAPAAGPSAAAPAAAAAVGPVNVYLTGIGGGPQNIAAAAAYDSLNRQAADAGFSGSQCRVTEGPLYHYVAANYWQAMIKATCSGEPAVTAPTRSLNRLIGPTGEHISTVWNVPPGYSVEGSLGQLYTSPREGTVPLYHCVVRKDNFLSGDVNCEGQTYVSRLGWFYPGQPAGVGTQPLMRCMVGKQREFFESNNTNCEGQTSGGQLGWISTG
ncbi:hypothetical protein [Streptomyces xanthophaeus]|uniref:Secreted protein n=1 Tax=Streptomyces xanthophaeus TaxID=67385 RepID=A0A919GTY3_9ACTN|nr:hypothetical protein [Streptomyces xanthophaeus]GHI83714.1 hypothetical protein Sxan_10780 [Streptomyces xanthophaeus]